MIKTLLFGVAVLFAKWDEPVDFRGLKWGISESEATATIREQWQKKREAGQIVSFENIAKSHQEPKRFTLSYRDWIGEVGTFLVLHFLNDRFMYASMSFDSKHFGRLKDAFVNRYGEPTAVKSESLQTRSGVRYDGATVHWIGRSLSITLKQYGATINDGSAAIGKADFLEYLINSERQKGLDASKDL